MFRAASHSASRFSLPTTFRQTPRTPRGSVARPVAHPCILRRCGHKLESMDTNTPELSSSRGVGSADTASKTRIKNTKFRRPFRRRSTTTTRSWEWAFPALVVGSNSAHRRRLIKDASFLMRVLLPAPARTITLKMSRDWSVRRC